MMLDLYRECLHRETWVEEHADHILRISDAMMEVHAADEDRDLVQEASVGKPSFDFRPIADLLAQALASEMLDIANDHEAFLYVRRKEEMNAAADSAKGKHALAKR